jgi:hypothetical protein
VHAGNDGISLLARLKLVLQSVETTESLLSEILENRSSCSRRELRVSAAFVAEAKEVIRRLIDQEGAETPAYR